MLKLDEDDVFNYICHNVAIAKSDDPIYLRIISFEILKFINCRLKDNVEKIDDVGLEKLLEKLIEKGLIYFVDNDEITGYGVTAKGMQTEIYQEYEYDYSLIEESK